MSRIVLKGDKLLRILYKYFGVNAIRQRGDHVIVKDNIGRATTIPVNKRELPQGTLNKILKDLGLTKEDIQKYI